MKIKFVKTKDYLLLVNNLLNSEDNKFYLYENDKTIHNFSSLYNSLILAHLPLNNNPVLEGVDLLPECIMSPEQWALSLFPDKTTPMWIDSYSKLQRESFMVGYGAAQYKQFTLEDIKEAITLGRELSGCQSVDFEHRTEQIQQSKLPIDFTPIIESSVLIAITDPLNWREGDEIKRIKTITNSQGQRVVQGEYKFN